MNPITGLFAALGAFNGMFSLVWSKAMWAARKPGVARMPATDVRLPTGEQLAVGFITNFFDALGVGSYAPTTSWFKLRRMVNDRIIPGTMTIGHNIPTMVETFIFTTIVRIDVATLFSLIAASVAGAWMGADIVAKLPRRKVQIGMGFALIAAGTLFFLRAMNFLPGGGDTLGLAGTKLFIGIGVHFMLGALMTIGIGMYAPCMITTYLLGMTPAAAYPIMMGSCGFLMPVAALPFIKEKSYATRPALGLTLGGIPGVVAAALFFDFLMKTGGVTYVRWLVIVVVLYTSISMLRSAFGSERRSAVPEAVEAEA